MPNESLIVLGEEYVPEVVDVLCESFADYPVMTYVLGENLGTSARLTTLIHFFVMARMFGDEVMLGIGGPTHLNAAALISRPVWAGNAPGLDELRETVWKELGASARGRYEAFGAACAMSDVGFDNFHLNMIGVRKGAQGRGLGRQLMERVQEMSRNDEDSRGVTLTTEDPQNVKLYEHFGYEIVGHQVVSADLETWSFFRPD
jgi:GNAT superfamily N-acetyltransferase